MYKYHLTDLERLEKTLRSIQVDDTWTPSELLDVIIIYLAQANAFALGLEPTSSLTASEPAPLEAQTQTIPWLGSSRT